jgi:hypothetical protein
MVVLVALISAATASAGTTLGASVRPIPLSPGVRPAQPYGSARTVSGLPPSAAETTPLPATSPATLAAGASRALPPPPTAGPQPGPSAPSGPQQTGWNPKTPPLTTPWTSLVSPSNDYPNYPSPQLTRAAWENLNGVWQFAAANPGESPPVGINLAQRILVPFPMESALSGIETHDDYAWYRRTFTIPASWAGQHVLVHFGAVDWQATVWVNGTGRR